MDSSTPGIPVFHCLLEFAQTHVRWVGDAIQLSHPLSPLLLPSIFPSIRFFVFFVFFSKESAVRNRCPEYWYFRFSINPSNEYSELVSFRIDWFELKPLFVTVVPLLFMFWIFWPLGKRDLSPSTRNWTWVPCIGRQSLNYWTTWEVPLEFWNSDLRTKTHMCWYSCGIET